MTIPPVRRGRRRDDSVDSAICEATLEILAVDGYANLTMGAVIARSGVSSATLYRRWPTKQDLVAAAVSTVTVPDFDVDTGSLLGDLAGFIAAILDAGCADASSLGDGVVGELTRNEHLRTAVAEKILAPRIDALAVIVDRAVSREELGGRTELSLAYSVVTGPIHHHTTVLGAPATADTVDLAARAAAAAMIELCTLTPSVVGR